MFKAFKGIRKLIVGVIGFTILFIGIILIFIPGPALIVITNWAGNTCNRVLVGKKFIDKI